MNFLAHIFLSGDDTGLQIGNFIGDAVKGSAYKNYPEQISKGIVMHRAIDSYTDSHPEVRKMVSMLRPDFGRYSPVLSDIYMDHILASRFGDFSDVSLSEFTSAFYGALIRNREHLPERIKRFMWHFITTDRLGKYARAEGVRESLQLMIDGHNIDMRADHAISFLAENRQIMDTTFDTFFSDLRSFCADYTLNADSLGGGEQMQRSQRL